MNLKIFSLAYKDDQVKFIARRNLLHNLTKRKSEYSADFIKPVNLSKLNIGCYQDNSLCESRIHISNLAEKDNAEYVGFSSWRFDNKSNNIGYPAIKQIQLPYLKQEPHIVWCAWPTNNWIADSISYHKGKMRNYISEMCEIANLPIIDCCSFWANNFICHKDIYLDFLKFYRPLLSYFHNKYKLTYDFYVPEQHKGLTPGVLYERITCLYFAHQNMKGNITLMAMPR